MRTYTVLAALAWLVADLGEVSVHGAELTVELGVARLDITPTYPIRLTGYGSRKTESEGVEQRLWAKALAIGSDEDGPAVLVTVDNLGVSGEVTGAVVTRLKKDTRATGERLAVCSSHTHTGPCLTNVAALIFAEPIPAEHQSRIDRYTQELTSHLEQVVRSALADRRPGRLSWSQGNVDFAINRRMLKEGHWTGFGNNSEGPVDHSLPVLRATDPDGKVRAIVLDYACHCTTLGGKFNRICGDWAGYAQEFIERENPGTTALVCIGCGADANPNVREDSPNGPMRHGESVAREVKRLLSESWTPLPGNLTAKLERIDLPFDKLPTREEWEARTSQKGPIAYHAKVNLARLDKGERLPTSLSYPVQTWCFGDDLAMVFLAGEVVVDYALRLKQECDGKKLWITAYANDDPCYIASRRVLAEGGYEVDGSMYYYDRPTHFAPEVEDLIVDRVKKLLPEAFKR